jgi:transposase
VISFVSSVRIVVAMRPVDFRRGAESLAALAREVLDEDPYTGVIVIFRSRRADRVKIVTWDQSGLVMLWKALDGSRFQWPPIVDGCMRLSAAQAAALLEGLEWRRVYPRETVAPTASR